MQWKLPPQRHSYSTDRPTSTSTHPSTMSFRLNLQAAIIVVLAFLAFASYHEGTGSTAWLQYTSIATILAFGYLFDIMFTDNNSFIFDPDADNWRRKTEAASS